MRRGRAGGGNHERPKGDGDSRVIFGVEEPSRSVIFVVLEILLVSLVICAPAARAQSWSEVVLHAFDSADGAYPIGLIQGRDGNFYGAAEDGGDNYSGTNYVGTLFKLTPQGTLTTLYSFCSRAKCTDGADPEGLIQGRDGNFYGTTNAGGANERGTAFKLTAAGKLTTLYSFCSKANCADGAYPTAGVIQGSDSNFYGTTAGGGPNPNFVKDGPGTVFKITPSGSLTTLYSFTGGSDGASPEAGLIQGRDGNFYGTTDSDGNSSGTVFKITPSGKLTSLHSFTAGVDPNGLAQGRDGNFYGTTAGVGDSGTVFKITPSGTLNTLYSFSGGTDGRGADGASPEAGLVQGRDGNFYGTTADGGANQAYDNREGAGTVFKITPSGSLTFLYSFCSKDRCTDGAHPDGLIQGTDGNLYGTTRLYEGVVFKLSPSPPTPVHVKLKIKPTTLKSGTVEVGSHSGPKKSP
jgi:uncharacterized repeat protein (TIGR03803 family)